MVYGWCASESTAYSEVDVCQGGQLREKPGSQRGRHGKCVTGIKMGKIYVVKISEEEYFRKVFNLDYLDEKDGW